MQHENSPLEACRLPARAVAAFIRTEAVSPLHLRRHIHTFMSPNHLWHKFGATTTVSVIYSLAVHIPRLLGILLIIKPACPLLPLYTLIRMEESLARALILMTPNLKRNISTFKGQFRHRALCLDYLPRFLSAPIKLSSSRSQNPRVRVAIVFEEAASPRSQDPLLHSLTPQHLVQRVKHRLGLR